MLHTRLELASYLNVLAWQLWVEIAVDDGTGQEVYTKSEKQFTLVRPFKVLDIDYKSGPYSGGTEIIVTGQVKFL
jgi:hypothetical protein